LSELPPEVQLSADQIRQLRLELQAVKEPLAMARGVSRFHGGRFPVKWSLDYMSTSLTCQDCRVVANLLSYDAKLHAQDGDFEGALASIVCIVGIAKSIGDEPTVLSQILRMAVQRAASETLERNLAQGQLPANSLANIQGNFEDEASQPLFLYGVRGERAGFDMMISAIESGQLKASSLAGITGAQSKLKSWLEDISARKEFKRNHASWIRIMTEIVEIAKLPIEETATEN